MLKITTLAHELAASKKLSIEAEAALKAKINEFMETDEIVALNQTAEDARVEYEENREKMLAEMQKQKQLTLKTEDGVSITRAQTKKVYWDDDEAVADYLEKNNPELVATVKQFNKTEAKKFLLEELELDKKVDGFRVEDTETLTVKMPK